MQRRRRCPNLAVLFHFVLVECRPIILFYLGFRKTLKNVGFTQMSDATALFQFQRGHQRFLLLPVEEIPPRLHFNITVHGDKAQVLCGTDECMVPAQPLSRFLSCMKKGILDAMWSLDTSYSEPKGRCVHFGDGQNLLGYLHLSCIVVCAFWLADALILLLQADVEGRRSGRRLSFGSGRYLSFTWRLEARKSYKITAKLVQCFAFGAVVGTVLFVWKTSYVEADSMVAEVMSHLTKHYNARLLKVARVIAAGSVATTYLFLPHLLGVVVYLFTVIHGAHKLAKRHEPKFNYMNEEFGELQFRRKWWKDLWRRSNDVFAHRLEGAILQAKCGNWAPLERLLVDPSRAGDVVSICAPGIVESNGAAFRISSGILGALLHVK